MVKLFSTEHTFAHPFSRVSSAFWRKYPNDNAAHVQAIDCYDRRMIHIGGPAGEAEEQRQPDLQPQLPAVDHPSLHVGQSAALPSSPPSASPSPSSSSLSSSASSSPFPSSSSPSSSSSTSSSSSPPSSTYASSSVLVSNRVISCYTALPVWLNKLGVSNHAYAIETSVVNPTTREMVVRSRNLTGSSFMVMEETCTYTANAHNPLHTDYRQTAKISSFLPMFASKFEAFTLNSMSKKSQEGLETIERLCQRMREEVREEGMDRLM